METSYRQYARLTGECDREKAIIVDGVIIGRPDRKDDTYVTEIKKISLWKHAIGQALVYSLYTDREPRIVLLDDGKTNDTLKAIIANACNKLGITLDIRGSEEMVACTTYVDSDWRLKLSKDHLVGLAHKYKGIPKTEASRLLKEDLVKRLQSLSLPDLTVAMLRHIIKAYGIKGTSAMRKAELVTILSVRTK